MKTFPSRRTLLFLELAGISCWWLSPASAETLLFTNFNFQPTEGGAGMGGVNYRYATEFITLGASATMRGAALLMRNADTVPHDVEAWLYAADGPGQRPGTLLTALTGGDDVIAAGQTGLATFSHAGFTLNPATQYWIVTGIAEPAQTDSVYWQLTLSNNADGPGMFTVSSTPTTYFNGSLDSGASFFGIGPFFNGQFGLSDTAPAINRIWNSGGGSNNWSDGANWSSNHAPANGDSLTFGSGVRTTSYADYASLDVNSVTFTNTAPAFTLHVPEGPSQPQLTINGALTNSGTVSQTLVADGATALGMNGGVLTINSNSMSGPITLIARGPTGAGPNGGVIQFFGAADGSGTRVITEPGTYFEFGARASDLRLGSIEGGGQILMGNNSLLVGYNNLDTEFSGTLAGGAGARLEKQGTGRLILSEANTLPGGTTVGAGTLEVRAPVNGLGLGPVSILPLAQLVFSQTAEAGFQTFTAQGSVVAGQAGGVLRFHDTASAGRITLVVQGVPAGSGAGSVFFEGMSGAGTSVNITVQAGTGTNGVAGTVTFLGTATATNAGITNRGTSFDAGVGRTVFRENASAATAVIVNEEGLFAGGATEFYDSASAGASVLMNGGSGFTNFFGTSTAGTATISNLAGTMGGVGGSTSFLDHSTAGTAQIVNRGSSGGFASVGHASFGGNASAGAATIVNRGATHANGNAGYTIFAESSTAGSATIINEAGTVANAPGAQTQIRSDGGTATMTARGSADAQGAGRVRFVVSGNAAASTLTAEGATAPGGSGGSIEFSQTATAGNAALLARSGLVAGAPGGKILFFNQASGGAARATIEEGGTFDISALTVPGMTIGSIEGAGTFFLGNKELVVGGNGASTTVSGTIASLPSGGALTKTGAGALTLESVNSYAGRTTVLEGILNLDSALLDADIAVFGGVLNVNGDVTGATIQVGSPIGTPTANFHTSQTLDSLSIGFGGVVVLGEMPPPAPGALAVPEPGIGALLASALLVAATPRRRKCPRRPRRAKEPRFPNRESPLRGGAAHRDGKVADGLKAMSGAARVRGSRFGNRGSLTRP